MTAKTRFLPLLPLVLIAGLSSCGDSPPPAPPQNFPPLDYSYLPPIRLNISNITIQNNYVPDPGAAALIGADPQAPADALTAMLQHRLVPDGTPGNGTVTIENASLEQVGGNYVGVMAVRLNVVSADGLKNGFTEASVSVNQTAPDADADPGTIKAVLYGVTKQLMDAMNVQLQYQIQRNMGSWVSYGLNAAAPPLNTSGGIQAAPLDAPGTQAPGTQAPAAQAPDVQPAAQPMAPQPVPSPPPPAGAPQSLTRSLGTLPVTPVAPPVTPASPPPQ